MTDAWGANTFPVRKYNSRTFHLKVRRSRLFRFFQRFPQINVGGDSVRIPFLEHAPASHTSPFRRRVGCHNKQKWKKGWFKPQTTSNTKKRRKNILLSKAKRGLLAKGRDKTAQASNEASNCSKMVLSILSTRVSRSLSKDLTASKKGNEVPHPS